MLPQPEFSQLYKFVAWLGTAFILSAVALPALLAQQDATLVITRSQLAALTPQAADVIVQKQHTIAFIYVWWPVVSGVLTIAGLGSLYWSLRTWRRRQIVFDETEELHREKLRGEVLAQSPTEIGQRAIAAAVEASGIDAAQPHATPRRAPPATLVNQSLAIDARIFARLSEALAPSYVGQPRVKIAKGGIPVYIDALFRSLRNDRNDIIVEMKYSSQPTGVQMRMRDAMFQVEKA
jgi:hypothetical protein